MQQASVILMEEHDHKWCAHIFLKKIKATSKVIKVKIIPQKFIHHTWGTIRWEMWKHVKVKINVSFSKTRFVSGWKLLTKGGRSTLANGWRWQRVTMVLVDGATKVLGANAHIVQTYSPTWANAHVRHYHADGGGIRSGAIFEDLWEANACVLILCSSCNVSQSPTMYQCKWVCVSWWPFSPPRGRNDRHQEWKSKNACQVVMLDGSSTNWTKRMRKTHWTLTRRGCGMWWYEWGHVKLRWKTFMISNEAIHVQVKRGKDGNVEGINTLKLMIACVRCMMFGDVLNLFLLHISNHNQDKEHVDVVDGINGPLV